MTAQIIVNGLVWSAIIALMAVGFTLIFGILRVVNYWHGEAYMFGAVAVFYLCVVLGLPYYLSLLLAVLAVGLLGWIVDKSIFQHLRGNLMGSAVASLGLLMIFQNVMWYVLGPRARSVPSVLTGTLMIGGAIISAERLFITCASFVVITFLYWFVNKTTLGKMMRAVQQDREAALAFGVDVDRVCGITFGMATGLAALAGGLVAPIFSISPPMGGTPLLLALVVVILGGMGSVVGAIIAAFIIGFQQSITGIYFGSHIGLTISAGIALIILTIRPRGLLGHAA